jgi:hypothetical protein
LFAPLILVVLQDLSRDLVSLHLISFKYYIVSMISTEDHIIFCFFFNLQFAKCEPCCAHFSDIYISYNITKFSIGV